MDQNDQELSSEEPGIQPKPGEAVEPQSESGEVISAADKTVAVSVEEKTFFKSRFGHAVMALLALLLVVGGGILAFLGAGRGDANDAPKLDFENISLENNGATELATDKGINFAGSYAIFDEDTGTEVIVTVNSDSRTITANGLPNHTTGEFPNESNPNAISAQSYLHILPLNPKKNSKPSDYNVETAFGIAVNGVLFDRYAAEYYKNNPNSGWQKTGIINDLGFDLNNAHVQPDGTYHYHGNPTSLIEDFEPQLLGFAADGFPVYSQFSYSRANDPESAIVRLKSSYELRSGNRPADGPPGPYDGSYEQDWKYVEGKGDLDKCNGRNGVTKEFPDGTYYYVITDDYPYIPTCFWGDVVDSFVRETPGSDGPQERDPGIEPPTPIDELLPPPGFDQ